MTVRTGSDPILQDPALIVISRQTNLALINSVYCVILCPEGHLMYEMILQGLVCGLDHHWILQDFPIELMI